MTTDEHLGQVTNSNFKQYSPEFQKILIWQKQNLDFATWGATLGADRYLRVRVEDFAATIDGVNTFANMAAFALRDVCWHSHLDIGKSLFKERVKEVLVVPCAAVSLEANRIS